MKIPFLTLFGCGIAFLIGGCAARSDFEVLYDQNFPKNSKDLRGVYRHSFDRYYFQADQPPSNVDSDRMVFMYYAVRGDPSAVHAFFNHRDRDSDGSFGESWDQECFLLLIRLGDQRFAELLSAEESRTREFVGKAIDPQVDWTNHPFPKTRALYSYRYVPRNS